jgi:flagellar biosynthesis GTPase FlhF
MPGAMTEQEVFVVMAYRGAKMRDLVFSVVVVLGALAVMQVSVDAAWAAKKAHHEKHEKQVKKEKKEDKDKKDKKDKKEDKDKEKDKRETNNCPGWLSKGCSPGACRCPVGPEEGKKPEKAEEKEKKPQKAEEKEKKPQKAESAGEPKLEKAPSRPEGCGPVQALSHHSSFVTMRALMCSISGRKLNACCYDLSMFDAHLADWHRDAHGVVMALHNITLSAGGVPDLDSNLIDRLVQDYVDHHRTKDLSALGDPIPREVMLQVAGL